MPLGRVLLVDDEEDFIEALSQRLKSRGLAVETARNGLEALRKIEEQSFDIVIMDLVMPELDGLETMERVRQRNPKLDVVFLTGKGDLNSGVRAMKLGASDFLEKPVRIEDLMEKIKSASLQRAILIEEEEEEKIRDILEAKGW